MAPVLHPNFRAVWLILCLGFLVPSATAQTLNREMKAVVGPVESNRVNAENDKSFLRVTSSVPNLQFSSNRSILSVNRLGSGDWEVWLPPGTHLLKVAAEGFRLLELPPFTYARKRSYELKLEPAEPLVETIPILVVVDPPDARIVIDGKDAVSGHVQQVTTGDHELRLEREGYLPQRHTIKASPANSVFRFQLKPIEILAVTIASRPSGARILLDGVDRGETDKGLFLYPGTYRLRLVRSGYLDLEQEITVSETGQTAFDFTLEPSTGTFEWKVSPSEARVMINREDHTGRTSADLAPGRYRVEVSAPGYVDTIDIIDLVRGRQISRAYRLRLRTGTLLVSVQPLDATVTLTSNGVVVRSWKGMRQLKDMSIGQYELVVESPGYERFIKKTAVEEGKSTVEDVVLRRTITTASQPAHASRPLQGMIIVPGGTFQMGSTSGDSDEQPVHAVTVSSFFMDETEVTYEKWTQVRTWGLTHGYTDLPAGGNGYNGTTNHPVTQVSWYDVVKWHNARSEMEGLTPCYYTDANQTTVYRTGEIALVNGAVKGTANGYRLPTEAEWEYAARGGSRSQGYTYSGSNDLNAVGWYAGNAGSNTHAVKTKGANELGLYDMSGNVWEWVWDWYGTYPSTSQTDPRGPTSGSYRVLRGGSFNNYDLNCRVANRNNHLPTYRVSNLGFRSTRTQ